MSWATMLGNSCRAWDVQTITKSLIHVIHVLLWCILLQNLGFGVVYLMKWVLLFCYNPGISLAPLQMHLCVLWLEPKGYLNAGTARAHPCNNDT